MPGCPCAVFWSLTHFSGGVTGPGLCINKGPRSLTLPPSSCVTLTRPFLWGLFVTQVNLTLPNSQGVVMVSWWGGGLWEGSPRFVPPGVRVSETQGFQEPSLAPAPGTVLSFLGPSSALKGISLISNLARCDLNGPIHRSEERQKGRICQQAPGSLAQPGSTCSPFMAAPLASVSPLEALLCARLTSEGTARRF